MIDQKTNKRIRKNKKTRKTRKRGRTNNKKTKCAGANKGGSIEMNVEFIKRLMKLNVYIREAADKATDKGTDKENRKIDFDVRTFHDFYDYLNETDMYLKKILTDELLAFTDPLKYKTNQDVLDNRTKIKPYEFGYKQKVEEVKKVEEEEEKDKEQKPPKN